MVRKAYTLAILFGVCFLIAPAVLDAGDPERIRAWIEQLRKTSPNARIQAAAKLGDAGNLGFLADSSLDPLANCLEDPDTDVRVYGAYALGRVGADLQRTVSLLIPLLVDPNEHVRYSAEWSLAEISKRISSHEITDEMANKLLDLFATLENQMVRGTFQVRHVEAVKLARIRLKSSLSKIEPAPKLEVHKNEAPEAAKDRDSLETSLLVSMSLYEANDIAGRLLLVDRMANESGFDDSLRLAVLRHELHIRNSSVAPYALDRWQDTGKRLLEKLFDQLNAEDLNAGYGENVVCLTIPSDLSHWDQLCKIAESTANRLELRLAALIAVESALQKGAPSFAILSSVEASLVRLVGDANANDQIRMAGITALSALGDRATKSVALLLGLVTENQLEPDLRTAIANAIASMVPTSREAADVIVECLKGIEVDDEVFPSLVLALGEFGSHGVSGLKRLMDGLSAESVVTRIACAESLEKIGIVAADAAPSLVALIANSDETIEVKSQAAKALNKMTPIGVELLISRLGHADATVREHVLRALAIAAGSNNDIISRCLIKLTDPSEDVGVRTAAASALGSVGSESEEVVTALLQACDVAQPTQLRAAAIIALARIEPLQAKVVIDANLDDSQWLVRASAAFGLHLCGFTTESIESLLELLDDSERDQLVLSALIDLGPSASLSFLQIVCDKERTPEERLCCIEALIENKPIPWSEIIKQLADDDIGDQTASLIESSDLFATDVVPILIDLFRSGQLNTPTRNRIVQVLQADGFGAVEDEGNWVDTFALNQPLASRIANPLLKKKRASSKLKSSAFPPPAPPVAAPSPSVAGSPAKAGLTAKATSPIIEKINDFVAESANAMETRRDLKNGEDRKVAVFYGTNRLPIASPSKSTFVTLFHVGMASMALVTMFGCFFLFPRHSTIRYVIASLIGMGTFATITLQALLVTNWQLDSKEQPHYTGVYSDEIQYGVCEVSIPKTHQPGELESPQLFKLEVISDPEKHIVLTNVECMPASEFHAALKTEMARKGKNIFVFIHGYNVSFEDAARRTAQMAHDLDFAGAPIFYSWPSQAKWYNYVMDQENIELSANKIRTFLLDIATTSQADTINLIAHSMGNVGLTRALSEIEQGSKPHFNQVVLAAPDIDADVFKKEIAPKIVSKSLRTTLYTSQTDLALISSRYFNQRIRAGDSGPEVLVLEGIETIDATAVDSSLLGHSYYGSNVSVLDDLALLLQNKPIEARQYLKAIVQGKKPYWAFEPTRISKRQPNPIENSR